MKCAPKLQPNIKKIYSYQEIIKSIDTWNDTTLVFFDVDDTLIYGSRLFPRSVLSQWIFRIRLLMKYPWLVKSTAWEEYYSLMWDQAERFLVEPEIVDIIKKLQKRNIVILGITSMETGSYGIIKNMPKWRANMLKKLEINFNKTFVNTTFKQFSPYRGNYPELYEGILCTNQQAKSKVLAAFLEHYNLKPNQIVYFDDEIYNLKEVSSLCAKKDINFEGYLYTKITSLPSSWSTERAMLQLDHLIQSQTWLTNQQATQLILNK